MRIVWSMRERSSWRLRIFVWISSVFFLSQSRVACWICLYRSSWPVVRIRFGVSMYDSVVVASGSVLLERSSNRELGFVGEWSIWMPPRMEREAPVILMRVTSELCCDLATSWFSVVRRERSFGISLEMVS